MRLIVDETDTVLILMQASSEGSIALLLGKALRDIGVKTIEYGMPDKNDTEKILEIIRKEKVTSIVALPTHMIALARQAGKREIASGAEGIYLRKRSSQRRIFSGQYGNDDGGCFSVHGIPNIMEWRKWDLDVQCPAGTAEDIISGKMTCTSNWSTL